jgi:hypothetical protein
LKAVRPAHRQENINQTGNAVLGMRENMAEIHRKLGCGVHNPYRAFNFYGHGVEA